MKARSNSFIRSEGASLSDANEDIPAKRSSDQEILHGFAPDSVRCPGHDAVRGDRYRGLLDIVSHMRRARIAQPGCGEICHDVGVVERAPAFVEMLVNEVGEVLSLHGCEEAADLRIALEVKSAGVIQGLGEAQGVGSGRPGVRRTALGMLEQQTLQRRPRHPTGRSVVGDVERTAGLQLGARKVNDCAAKRRGDPAIDAVQRDGVEFAEVGETRLQQLVKACFDKADVVELRGFGKRVRGHDMGRVEVDADERHLRV
jgi:hypothetical protein